MDRERKRKRRGKHRLYHGKVKTLLGESMDLAEVRRQNAAEKHSVTHTHGYNTIASLFCLLEDRMDR